MAVNTIDIREDALLEHSPQLLAALLKDHTMSRRKGHDCNIFWATHDYEHLGAGFGYSDPRKNHLKEGFKSLFVSNI